MAEKSELSLFKKEIQEDNQKTPAETWEENTDKRALDELFKLTYSYKSSKSYYELVKFVTRFWFYSPYNAMLINVQMPGAKFVAPPNRWLRIYGRRIKSGARPIVILQPMGPVMFVFDVSDTEPTKKARPLPPEVENPFEVKNGFIGPGLERIIENAKRDGVRIIYKDQGSQAAGLIGQAAGGIKQNQEFQTGVDKNGNSIIAEIPVRYDMIINRKLSREGQYATIVHELAHLYCGHLGTFNVKWWADRRGLKLNQLEFEAESVAYLVCARANIANPSDQYLAGYINEKEEVPPISLESVMKTAGLIEKMSKQKMKPRK